MRRQWSVCHGCPELRKRYNSGYLCLIGRENEYVTPSDFCRHFRVPMNCVRLMEQLVMGQRSIQQ